MSDNILVRVPASERHHVQWDKLDPDEGYAWWCMGRLPKREAVTAYFLCGEEIIGEATAEVDREEGRLFWHCAYATMYVTPVPFKTNQRQGWRYFPEADHEGAVFQSVMDALEEANDRIRKRRAQERQEAYLWDQTFGAALADEIEDVEAW